MKNNKQKKDNTERRNFIKKTATGIWGVALMSNLPILAKKNKILYSEGLGEKMFYEKAHEIPIVEETDVVVCGGGPAGFAAALSAARTGASVTLLEVHGCLGGVWTSGMLAWLFEFDKPGITQEITKELDKRGARRGTNKGRYVYEVEEMKLLLEEKCVEEGVKFQLFTRVVAAYKGDDNKLNTVITESKSGRQAWKAKVFIDATGDGDLGALAGCGWDYGYKDTGITQPMTYMSLITVKNATRLGKFISFYEQGSEIDMAEDHVVASDAFKKELLRAGIEPSYGHPTLFRLRDNLIALMINHEYGFCSFNSAQMTEATVNGRAEVNKVVRALRNLGGDWQGVQLVASCEQIGVREGRRIHGRYTVTDSDLIMGVSHEDAIAHVTFGIDIHAATAEKNSKSAISNTTPEGLRAKPYDIPLRALIAKDVDGLLMAGRCISGDFIAHASYRVTGTAVSMGQAAGVVAGIASNDNRLPHEIEWTEASAALQRSYKMSESK